MHAAIPQYIAGVSTITQYVYSDSSIAEIECPLQLGRLSSLYQFSWNGVVGDKSGPITNGSQVYWLCKENNRILHVNLSTPGDLRKFQCVGEVQTCTSSSCGIEIRNSPTITVLNIIGAIAATVLIWCLISLKINWL